MDELELRVTRDRDGLTLHPVGALDHETAPLLSAALVGAAGSAPARLAVDLASVDFIDSSGIRALVEVHRRAHEQGIGALSISGASDQARRLLHMTGLHNLFALGPAPD